MRRLAFVALVMVLFAGACGDDKEETTATTEPTATTASSAAKGPQEFAVDIEGKTDAFNGELAAFFPNKLSARPGDTVKFDLAHFSGVPHTVTLGTLIDKGVATLEKLGPTASIAATENNPEMLKVPDVFPHASPKGGPPDANQSAGQPCFLATGVPPLSLSGSAPACPKVAQPDFDGTQAFYNSGILTEEGDTFSVKLADDIKPGTYNIMCLIHRAVMTSKLTVAPSGTAVPGPEAVKAAGKKQFDTMVTTLTPVAEAAQKNTPDKAALGSGDPQHYPSVVIAEFGPKNISIPVGGTVTWNQFAFHSLTFGATDADVGVLAKAPDGAVHLTKGGAPDKIDMPPSVFEFPPPDNGKPVVVNYTYPGSGFASTGVPGSLPPVFITYKVTFPKAGTYAVRCLVHPDMKGEVKVG